MISVALSALRSKYIITTRFLYYSRFDYRSRQTLDPPLSAGIGKADAMKESSEKDTRVKRRSTSKTFAAAAAVLAVIQACLTIEGMGIEGFILWVVILFVGYWLFFTLLAWLWQRFRDRA